MAGLANPPGFGGNRWGDNDWARFNRMTNSPFSVGSSTDWAPTINTGANRTLNIAAGAGQAAGVTDITTATETIAFAANGGGTDRFDALVARFDWSTKTRVFAVIQGTTSPPAVNAGTSLDVTKINRIPGVRYDGLIAIAKVRPSATIFQPGDLYSDMRVWGGNAGPLVSNTISSLRGTLDVPVGGQLTINGLDTYIRQPSGSLVSTCPRLSVIGAGTQTIPFNSDAQIALSNVLISTGVSYNPANGRCTFIETGDYWVAVNAAWPATPNFRGKRNVAMTRNGSPILYGIDSVFPNDADASYNHSAALLHFDAGDYTSLIVAHEAEVPASGSNVDITIDRSRCQLSVMYAGG